MKTRLTAKNSGTCPLAPIIFDIPNINHYANSLYARTSLAIMSRAQSAPQQPSQTSRKGKRAWRKNVDISDVQDGLERLRDEMITGYAFQRYLRDSHLLRQSVVRSQKRHPKISLLSIDMALKVCGRTTKKPTSPSKRMRSWPSVQ